MAGRGGFASIAWTTTRVSMGTIFPHFSISQITIPFPLKTQFEVTTKPQVPFQVPVRFMFNDLHLVWKGPAHSARVVQ